MRLLGLLLWQGKQYNTKDVRFNQSSLCHAFYLSPQRILVVTKHSSFSMRREKL